ncbi:group II intron reverse transcriptase/maturase [Kiritimatiella glycovorans]|uniref:Group II intron-encoded protein LtrA n=1 Tax=Kiritimatiella glycovorans TaxID=1307763 RepID=A0A0G3EH88_9BACT|nr:group II intron reverse transcriptase/maturase [Kiritimatiella glycovorans]AKJ64185.1 Group II intron-encoded protein LtrA [Kiritimatiella glycovorans]
MTREKTASKVPPGANPDAENAELRERLGADPLVWTDAMLAALKSGVKGGKWFSLKDKVYRRRTLLRAWHIVNGRGGSGGVDRLSLKQYESQLDQRLASLEGKLKTGRYEPKPVKRVFIPKPGGKEKRPLGIPTVEDRIVQTALQLVIGPIFEIGFNAHSYGFRPKRGCKDALREVGGLLRKGHEWIVDADLKSYFDTIDHGKLMSLVRAKVADGLVLDLLESYLKQGLINELKEWEPTEKGTPQGAVISPLLANLYLNELDHLLRDRGHEMIRYADDFVILSRTREEAEDALELTRQWTDGRGLVLHPEKTRLVTHREGFEFLGYRFENGNRYVRQKSLTKLRGTLRPKTKRTKGKSMKAIIEDINPVLIGWFGYYKHAHKNTFVWMDGWVRMRLRSILRKRHGRKGRGRGLDHHRYPNKYFAEMGLFSLERAHREACQSR